MSQAGRTLEGEYGIIPSEHADDDGLGCGLVDDDVKRAVLDMEVSFWIGFLHPDYYPSVFVIHSFNHLFGMQIF